QRELDVAMYETQIAISPDPSVDFDKHSQFTANPILCCLCWLMFTLPAVSRIKDRGEPRPYRVGASALNQRLLRLCQSCFCCSKKARNSSLVPRFARFGSLANRG